MISTRIAPIVALAAALPLAAFTPLSTIPSGPSGNSPRGVGRQAVVDFTTQVRVHNAAATTGDPPSGMVWVPEGLVRIGVARAEVERLATGSNAVFLGRLSAMTPDHLRRIDGLWIDRGEVTNEQFRRFLASRGVTPAPELLEYDWNWSDHGQRREGIPPGEEFFPVRGITFNEARDCARWLGRRLPTEDEWELAGRRTLPADQYFPWGRGFGAWDPKLCACAESSIKPGKAPQTYKTGHWPKDVSVDGVFDLCGNVAEWVDSPFTAYPEFGVPTGKAKGRDAGEASSAKSGFDPAMRVVRGGSSWGNQLSNNLVMRVGMNPSARLEAVGFRAAASPIAGLDVLAAGLAEIAPLLPGVREKIALDPDALVAAMVTQVDGKSGVIDGARWFAFARVKSLPKSLTALTAESWEDPIVVGLVDTTVPLLRPALKPGTYVVGYRGAGQSEAQKRDQLRTKQHRPAEPGARVAAAQDPAARVVVPIDQDVLVFTDRNGDVVAWTAVNAYTSGPYATRIGIKAANPADAVAGDAVTLRFAFLAGSRTRFTELACELHAPAGALPPVEMPGGGR